MSAGRSSSNGHDEFDLELGQLVEFLTDRVLSDPSFDVEGFLAEHAGHAEQIRRMLPTIRALAGVGLRSRGRDSTATRADSDPSPSMMLGDFQLLRSIGRGGMGVVYEAEQISLHRRVAVKVLPFASLWTDAAIERFRQEVRIVAQLEHPHIVPVYAVGFEQGVHFYAMKLIDGCSLAGVIRHFQAPNDTRPISPLSPIGPIRPSPNNDRYHIAARLAQQAAQALSFAHQHGVIHRDIKPSNLLLDREGHLFVADFGLARFESDVNLTRTGDLLGTPRYMSPEQAAGDSKQVDHRTDIYSLGATLYELLTLHPVITAQGRPAAIQALRQLRIVPPRAHDPRIPRPLEQIVLKCLQPSPDNRYTTAAELADDLQRFLDGRPVSAQPPGLVRRGLLWARRHRRISLSIVALIATCLLIYVIVSSNAQHRGQIASPRGPPGEEQVDTSPGASSPLDLNPDQESPDMLRSPRINRPNQKSSNGKLPNRRLGLEPLESRQLLAVTMSVSDGVADEGGTAWNLVDTVNVSSGSTYASPWDVAFESGDLYVTYAELPAFSPSGIARVDGITGQVDFDFIPGGTAGLDTAREIAIHGGWLYVANKGPDDVLRFDLATGVPDPNGAFIGPGDHGLSTPRGLVFDAEGDLYVSSKGTNQIFKYNGMNGTFIGVFANNVSNDGQGAHDIAINSSGDIFVAADNRVRKFSGVDGSPQGDFVSPATGGLQMSTSLTFGPNGDLYVCNGPAGEVLQFNGQTGGFVGVAAEPTTGEPQGLAFDASGSLFVANHLSQGHLLRYASSSVASFTLSLSNPSETPVSVTYDTANGSATAGSDFATASGTVTFLPGQTTRTLFVQTLDDAVYEGNETFVVNLSSPVGASIVDGQAVATIYDDEQPPTKFYVVDDASANHTYEYGPTGSAVENYSLNSGNSAPRGAASTAAGDKVWVVDANRKVYVYDTSGGLLGSWTAGSLASNADEQGIATNGTDIWIVDAKSDKVFRYAGAASRLSGSQNAASSFSLNSGNKSPKDIVTNGAHLWVVNDSTTDKVFKYTVGGSLVGSWTISGGGGSPTGITIDPSNVSDIWIVDSSADKVFQYTAAASRTSGSQSASANFVLAPGNTNPQGIADPPPAAVLPLGDVSRVLPPAADMALAQLLDDSRGRRPSSSARVESSTRHPAPIALMPAWNPVEANPGSAKDPRSFDRRDTAIARRHLDAIDELYAVWERDELSTEL